MLKIQVDTTEFDKKLKEYMKYSKRELSEAINQKAYYIARNAVGVTKAATKEEIKSDLEAASRKFPRAPVAAILVNKERATKGLKGLYGSQMSAAIERFIRIRQAHRNFLRSGWIPAIRKLEALVPKRNGAKIPAATERAGRSYYGGAKPARPSLNPLAEIWNSVFAKHNTDKVRNYLQQGAQKAIDLETASMEKYIRSKLEKAARKAGFI